MLRVGIVGWRGMVGSVLVQRMREERDFAHVDKADKIDKIVVIRPQ